MINIQGAQHGYGEPMDLQYRNQKGNHINQHIDWLSLSPYKYVCIYTVYLSIDLSICVSVYSAKAASLAHKFGMQYVDSPPTIFSQNPSYYPIKSDSSPC